MKTRRRSKTVTHDEDEGASTSYDQSSVKTTSSPKADNDESYHFPARLVKDRHWKETALSVKNTTEVAQCIDVTTIFDFFNKLCVAFNLTAVTEQQLDDAIVAERSSPNAAILIKMVVELVSGFSSVDYSHTVRMYQRNKIYHETNAENFNQSLWTFYSHDWKFMDMGRWQVENILGPSKEDADFFSLPFRLRSALLVDLCMYRISCPNAQDMIDSIADESKRSLGSQLRTEPIGVIDNANIYYFGGVRVYRSKVLPKKKQSKIQKLSKSSSKRKSDKHISNGANDEMKRLSKNVESANNVNENNHLLDRRKEKPEVEVIESGGEKDNVKLEDSKTSCDNSSFINIGQLVNQEYFSKLLEKQSTWEVICCTEDELHYLIEYCRTNRSSIVKALANVLINKVLPSVQKCLRKQREASRFIPRVYDPSQFGDFGPRHSQRLEQKKLEREKQLEIQRQKEIEMENIIREQEGKRKLYMNNETVELQPKISREERLRLREQRILEQEVAKRRKLEAKLDLTKDMNSESSVENHEPTPSTSAKISDHCDVVTGQRRLHWTNEVNNRFDRNDSVKVHRRKQTFDVCEKPSFCYSQQQFTNIMNEDSASDVELWKELRLNGDDVFEKQKQHSLNFMRGPAVNSEGCEVSRKRRYSVLSNSICPPQFNIQSSLPLPLQVKHRSAILHTPNEEQKCSAVGMKRPVMIHRENRDANIIGKSFLQSTPSLPVNDNLSLNSKFGTDQVSNSIVNSFEYDSQGRMMDENTKCSSQEESDSEELTKIIVTKYLDYPSMENSGSFFRILVPDGSYMTLIASGPLLDHDYIVPPVELIIDQKWKFAADPLEPDSTFQPIEFSLQKQEPVVPPEELVDIET